MATATKTAAASVKKPEANKLYTVFIPATSREDTERYVGTPRGNYLVKTNTMVEVPKDVKEALELAEMQKASIEATVEKFRLKD